MPDRAPATRRNLALIAFLALLLLMWQAVFSSGVLPSYSLPSPAQVATRLAELARDGMLWPSVEASVIRMVLGFVLSAALGLALGVAMGLSPVADSCLRSLFLGLQTLPSVAWVPIALLLFGLGDAAIYFVIVMSSMAAMAIATADGIANIPPHYLRAARSLGTSGLALPTRVALPAALPSIVTGVKLGWTLGWHGVVSAELIKSSIGLGFLLHAGRELNDAAQVVGIMLVTIFIGLLLDRVLFAWAERRIRARWGFATDTSR
ncbi:MAG TPA: ABC transporter permease [Thermoanaerobaculaceae bacterium]|nr:ABC transporter permease [Thermoanaerobaculaceae bacterium]